MMKKCGKSIAAAAAAAELVISLFSAERIALTDSGDPNDLLAGLESYEVKAQVDFQDIVAFNNH